jgi:hypothetical protein
MGDFTHQIQHWEKTGDGKFLFEVTYKSFPSIFGYVLRTKAYKWCDQPWFTNKNWDEVLKGAVSRGLIAPSFRKAKLISSNLLPIFSATTGEVFCRNLDAAKASSEQSGASK